MEANSDFGGNVNPNGERSVDDGGQAVEDRPVILDEPAVAAMDHRAVDGVVPDVSDTDGSDPDGGGPDGGGEAGSDDEAGDAESEADGGPVRGPSKLLSGTPCGICGGEQAAIRINVDGNTLLMESCDGCDVRRWQLAGQRIDLQEALNQVGEHSGRRR